jgi:hypothetical protein
LPIARGQLGFTSLVTELILVPNFNCLPEAYKAQKADVKKTRNPVLKKLNVSPRIGQNFLHAVTLIQPAFR